MAKFGGEMNFTVNGKPIKIRGTFNVNPTNVENEGIANQDNSVSAVVKPVGFGAEVSFEDSDGLDWNALLRDGPYNFTVTEDYTGRIHMWTRAHFVGRPEINRLNGEVTGLTIIADAYRAVNG